VWAADPVVSDPVLVRRLIEAMKDTDPDVRVNLAVALAKIGPAAVEPLVAALKDSLPERRAGAAQALGQIGAGAKAALPSLLDALDDTDRDVRRQASFAVSRIVPNGNVKPPARTPPTGDKP
jgi:HEAT repeat protein